MVIEDKELLGDFSIEVVMDGFIVREPNSKNDTSIKNAKYKDISSALNHVFRMLMARSERTVTLQEYLDNVQIWHGTMKEVFSKLEVAQ